MAGLQPEISLAVLCLLVLTHLSHACAEKRIQCPCGTSGTNVTICYSGTRLEFDYCEKFRHCDACSDNESQCSSCPTGKSGVFCTEKTVQDVKRFKRQAGNRCPDMPGPKLGSIRCRSSRYESECTGRCLPGHSFRDLENEELILRCMNGRWQPRNSFPQCVSDGFCELEMVGAGSYNCTTGVQGTRCDVRCTGRVRVSNRYFCYPGEDWKPPLPHCIQAKGPMQPAFDCQCQNGGVCDAGTCRCLTGYEGIYCEREVYPVMTYCADPGRVSNGDRVDTDARRHQNQMHQEGSTVAYTCRRGYVLRGASRLTCLQDGGWSADPPSCQRIRTTATTTTTTARPEPRGKSCPDPGLIRNGERWGSDGSPAPVRRAPFQPGASLVYSCRSDFALHGPSLIRCLPSGVWSRDLPQCRRIAAATRATTTTTTTTTTEAPDFLAYCEDPGKDPNGDRIESPWLDARRKNTDNEGLFPQGMELEYSCREGYTLVGEAKITCLFTERWSNRRPVCQQDRRLESLDLAYCNDPGYVPNSDRTIVYNISERQRTSFVDDGDVKVPEGVKIEYVCDDGLELAGKRVITCLSTGAWSDPPPECRTVCGKSFITVTKKIIRGNRTSAGEWPWQVAIGVAQRRGRPEIICGGVLVGIRTALTAAHCVDGIRIHRTTLYFGKYYLDTNQDDEKVLVRQPTSFVIHPRYNRETYDYDIAIVKFEPDIRMSYRIQPICLPNSETTRKNLASGNQGYVIGWGLTEHSVYPDSLLMARVPFVPEEKCEREYRQQNMEFPITENMYCAGYDDANSDSCTGDSGGPMTFLDRSTNSFVLEGLVSYGVLGGCGLPRRYTVYTKVGNLMRWVRANL